MCGPLFQGGGVSVGRGGSDEEKAEGLTDYRQGWNEMKPL